MGTAQLITLARKHISCGSSRQCLADAIALYDDGDFEAARTRATKSLAYSVGVFHRDYVKSSND